MALLNKDLRRTNKESLQLVWKNGAGIGNLENLGGSFSFLFRYKKLNSLNPLHFLRNNRFLHLGYPKINILHKRNISIQF